MDQQDLLDYEREIQVRIPGFSVDFKDTSKIQALIALLVRPFNRDYSTKYTSTFYPKVYFPNQSYYKTQPRLSFTTLSHEFVHLEDTKAHPIWFRLGYALPQALALVAMLSYLVLGCVLTASVWPVAVLSLLVGGYCLGCKVAEKSNVSFFALFGLAASLAVILAVVKTGWLSLLMGSSVVFFAPWPSPWRAHWELRGYTMTMAVLFWIYGTTPDTNAGPIAAQFYGPSYYFMRWGQESTENVLKVQAEAILNGEILKDPTFAFVYNFLKERKLLHV